MSIPLVMVGAGGHAAVCIDTIQQLKEFEIIAIVGLKDETYKKHILGITVTHCDEDLEKLRAQSQHAFIGIGQIGPSDIRRKLFNKLTDLGFILPSIVGLSACVSKYAALGAGTIIMNGAIVGARVVIGLNSIINHQALVDHDSIIGDHCHLSTGSIVNGSCSVGSGTFLGSNSCLKNGITVGENCLIGMGVNVKRSHPKDSKILD